MYPHLFYVKYLQGPSPASQPDLVVGRLKSKEFNSFITQVYCDKSKQEPYSGSARLWDMTVLVVKEFDESTVRQLIRMSD